MYTPKFNEVTDRAILLEAMRAHAFAILFGPGPSGEPTATHLPLTILNEGDDITLEGHFAKANSHWKSLANKETLAVFPGPHTYVSPTLYASQKSVPTWNYIAIHAIGTLQIIEDQEDEQDTFAQKGQFLRRLIAANEPSYAEQWDAQPITYRISMTNGIVGFRIPVTKLEGKFKLSQNRPEDYDKIHSTHSQGSDDERQLAMWMERLKR
jgi:transcriptional regulator